MTWEGVVWLADTEANLGHHSFRTRPKPGELLEIDGVDHVVVFAGEGFCYGAVMRGEGSSAALLFASWLGGAILGSPADGMIRRHW